LTKHQVNQRFPNNPLKEPKLITKATTMPTRIVRKVDAVFLKAVPMYFRRKTVAGRERAAQRVEQGNNRHYTERK
jgi:hypothetical protein